MKSMSALRAALPIFGGVCLALASSAAGPRARAQAPADAPAVPDEKAAASAPQAPAAPQAAPPAPQAPPAPAAVLNQMNAKDAQGSPALEAPDDDALMDANERQISAAQAIAELQRAKLKRQESLVLSKIDDLETYEYQGVRGANEADAVKAAGIRALKSAAARVYFDDYILLGRDLLEPYLGFYGGQFIARNTVLARRILADGTNEIDARVSIDMKRLYDDLNKKHFISKPEVRPLMAVALEEKIDGQPTTDGRGRKILEKALETREMRTASDRMGQFPLYLNANLNENALLTARHEAQRGGIGALVTGTLNVVSRPSKKILYDDFHFYTAEAQLFLIRVDTGEVLTSASQTFSSSATDQEAALTKTFEQLMTRISEPLAADFLPRWRNTMFDVADVRLMITGINQEQLETVFNLMKTISPESQTYTKSFYGDVAVLNVSVPKAQLPNVEKYLRSSRTPQFIVKAVDNRRFELKVL